MERLGVAGRSVAFYAAQAQVPFERIAAEPATLRLCRKTFHQYVQLVFETRFTQRYIDVGMAQVAFVLWNLIFQNQMTTEGVPGQLGEQPMILVPVGQVMREDQVGRDLARHALE